MPPRNYINAFLAPVLVLTLTESQLLTIFSTRTRDNIGSWQFAVRNHAKQTAMAETGPAPR